MKIFFIPSHDNDYHPYFLRLPSLCLILAIVIFSNLIFGASAVFADIDFNALYQEHNNERAKFSLNALHRNQQLVNSATAKAKAMLESDCWSHYCPNGKSPWDFFAENGYTYTFAGENLGEGFENNQDLMLAWMNSPTHRANVVNKNYTEIGIGFARGKFQGKENNVIVVVHFGSREASSQGLQNSAGPLQITSPRDSAVTNNPYFPIIGKTHSGSSVEISDRDQRLGRVDANGENFSYQNLARYSEGSHIFTATAFDKQQNTLGKSPTVEVTIDTNPPVISLENLAVRRFNSQDQEKVTIYLYPKGADIADVSVNNERIQLISDFWQGEFTEVQLKDGALITVHDLAGNITKVQLSLNDLIALENNIKTNTTSLGQVGTKDILNYFFGAFLALSFLVDFIALKRLGLTGLERGKSHLHLGAMAIIFFVLIFGSASGSILSGLIK